jgi:uncharacterized protein YbbC (DUF1343 family)
MTTVSIGLEQLVASAPNRFKGQRLGLLCNAASVDRQFVHARRLLKHHFGSQLKVLFSPQHGLFAEKQDNMIESSDRLDPVLEIPVRSLYSHTRIPTQEMFDPIDTLIVDLQDVGTRVYTFIYTMSYCLEAARQYNKKIVVLDRPNPIGGVHIEGNCLSEAWRSFVGRYPMPMRHGMTIAELALMFNQTFGIGCDLEVIPMKGWRRHMRHSDTGLPWVAPSPNLPTPMAALVYPGQVIWEGTNVSEGRGTTQPFELFGAPFISTQRIRKALDPQALAGAILRTVEFEPNAQKWQGQICRGFQIHVTDPEAFKPYRTSLSLLQAVLACHPEQFEWKQPPYEYEYDRMPIDLILGDMQIRRRLADMEPMATLTESWQQPLKEFDALRKQHFLYG